MKLTIKERQPNGEMVTAVFDLELTGGTLYAGAFVLEELANKLRDLLLRLEIAGNADGTMRVWIEE